MRRGFNSIDDLRANSVVDAMSHCWHWQGSKIKGKPRIWAADLDHMDKRVLSGPRAVWYIAHGTQLGALVAYMGCWTGDCVCPAHVRSASRRDVNGLAVKAGLLQGHHAVRRISAAKARAAAGHVDTPAEVVMAIRARAGSATGRALAIEYGVSFSTASRILRGSTHKQLGVDA